MVEQITSGIRIKSQLLPNYVLLDMLKWMSRIGLAKIQDTAQLINNIIKQDFASKPLHIIDNPSDLRIRRNEKNEVLVGFWPFNRNCFEELQDCDMEEDDLHFYQFDEMRPFLAKYIRFTEVKIKIDNVDKGLPPYAPEQITLLESISHIWTGQTLIIDDYFEGSIDYNLKGILGSSAILQCHSLNLMKYPDKNETMTDIITDLQQCSYLYTLPGIYSPCCVPILKDDILRLIHYKAAYPQSDTTLVLYNHWIYSTLDAFDKIKEEFLTSTVPCRLRVIIEIVLDGSASLVQYNLLASSQPERLQYCLENNRTKEVLQLKQITKQEAKEKFNAVLYEREEDSFTEVTDGKSLILERYTV